MNSRPGFAVMGRAVVPKAPAESGQWEICIGGKKVPALTKEDLARVQAKQEGTWESRFNARVQAQQQNTIRKDQLTDGQHAAMHKYLWAAEIDHIEKLQTKKYTDMPASPRDRGHLEA